MYKGITDNTFKATMCVFVFKTLVTFLPQDKLWLEANQVTPKALTSLSIATYRV